MAQQTQAARAAEHWQRFMARFPTVRALAAATTAEVLREWQGLGYDRRALALHRAAKAIVKDHGGKVPDRVEVLQTLPGIGPYTARAVAAIGYGRPVGAVDVNVSRVLRRVITGDAAGIERAELQALADAAVPPDRAADWTHAVMDVGATLCRARRPRCDGCPARPWCRYAEAGAGDAAPTGPIRRSTTARATPFTETNRWLRGRILDLLRAAPDDRWIPLHAPIGIHDAARVRAAATAMAADGLLEIAPDDLPDGPVSARLPIS
jgi:A/G-specific adenine glycosylase